LPHEEEEDGSNNTWKNYFTARECQQCTASTNQLFYKPVA